MQKKKAGESSIAKTTVISAVVSYSVAVVLYIINLLTALVKVEWIGDILSRATMFGSFDNFIYGVFDIRAAIYYLSITAVFALLSYRSINKRRFM